MIEEYTVGDDRELDMRLARYDVEGSLAHIAMLETIGLLTREELEKPFPQEDELREKSARLVELNAELDMENTTEPQEAEKPSVLAKLKEPIPLYEPKTHQVKYEEACR